MPRKFIIYFGLVVAIAVFLSNFAIYFYARANSPRQPDISSGHVFSKQMQQPFVVYLTDKQVEWLNYSLPIAMLIFLSTIFLNNKWKVIQNDYEKIPYLTRRYWSLHK